EGRRGVAEVAVELDERSGIEELDQARAREQLPLLALSFDRLLGACVLRFLPKLVESVELRLRGVGAIVRRGHVGSLTRPSESRRELVTRPCSAWHRSGRKAASVRDGCRSRFG